MAENKIIGYKKIFGFVLPDWVDEKQINLAVGYLLVSLVMVFVLLLVVKPNSERVTVNKNEYKIELDKLNSLKESKKSLDELSNTVDPVEQQAVFQSMPVNYAPEESIFQLRNIAALSGVSITEYSLPGGLVLDDTKKEFSGSTSDNSEASIRFQSFPMSISVSGEINSILKFIEEVEKSLPIGFVSDLGIQEATKISNTGKSQTTLKLEVTYYQPIMVSFNLSNLQKLSAEDITLIKELGVYAQKSFQSGISSSTTTESISNNQNIFGL